MIVFRNPGQLDLRGLKTFGLTSKTGQDKIGRFGTGLKYAVAVIVRNGGKVAFWSGDRWREVGKIADDFRGQSVERLTLDGDDLPFTADLGRDWEIWQAFRELYSNALDEGGDAFRFEDRPDANEDETVIAVEMDAFEAIYFSLEEHFIGRDEKPIWTSPSLDVYSGRSAFIFYRGIAIMKVKEPAAYRYNLKGHIDLTEDRTAKYDWQVRNALTRALIECDEAKIASAICDGRNKFEAGLDFSDSGRTPSESFLGAAVSLGASCNPTAMAVVRAQLPADARGATVLQKGAPGAEALRAALGALRAAGGDLSKAKFVLAAGVPMYTDYDVRGDAIFLREGIFENPDKMAIAVFEGYNEVIGNHWLVRQLIASVQAETWSNQ